jgi:two-component system sensor histidine kinase YesM
MLVSTLLISYIYSKELKKQAVTITEQKMNIIAKNLEDEIEKIIQLQNTIQDDNVLQELMTQRPMTDIDQYKREVAISGLLRQYSYSDISVNSIFAFDMSKNILDSLYKIDPYDKIVKEFDLFEDFIGSKKYSAFSKPSNFPTKSYNGSEDEKNTITYFSNYIDENYFNQIGYLLINIKKDYFFKDVIKSCTEEFDFALVMDENSNVILQVGEVPANQPDFYTYINNKDNNTTKINHSNTYIIQRTLDNYEDWVIIAGIAYDVMNEGERVISRFIFIIGILSIVVVFLFSFYMSQKITNPIITVVKSMSKIDKGQWPDPIRVDTEDELKILVEGFNTMVVDVKNLIEQVRREQEEKAKYKIDNLELKLELLQSQINPHFVHNTLNAIKYHADTIGAYQVKDMIESFNQLLRASMSVGTDYINIEEEIKCVKSFLNIFKHRYDYNIELILTIQEDLKCNKIPKLILQPIVENSAYHGILPKGDNGQINISIYSTSDEHIRIEVYDNGIGISEEKINSVLNSRNNKKVGKTKNGFNNIGLSNINDRLKLYYGYNYKLKIKSDINKGTMVYFDIPKR